MAGSQQPGVDPRPRTESERIGALVDQLSKIYPHIEKYVGVRSTDGAGGSNGAAAVQVNLDAYVFLHSRYWTPPIDPDTESPYPMDEHTAVPQCRVLGGPRFSGAPSPRCGRCSSCVEAMQVRICTNPGCGADRRNWRSGFKLTVFLLEANIRRALGFGLVSRPGPGLYPDQGTDLRVLDALAYIKMASHTLVEDHRDLARDVREELWRILARCTGMIDGRRAPEATGWNPICQYCGLTTVHSDRDRAVCANPECKAEDGTRRCWVRDPETETWNEVDEPGDRRGRGSNLTDEQLWKRVYGA